MSACIRPQTAGVAVPTGAGHPPPTVAGTVQSEALTALFLLGSQRSFSLVTMVGPAAAAAAGGSDDGGSAAGGAAVSARVCSAPSAAAGSVDVAAVDSDKCS